MCIVCLTEAEDHGVTASSVDAPAPGMLTEEQVEAGRALLRRHPSVDIHAHPGRFFMPEQPSTPFIARYPTPNPEQAVADMRRGGVAAALFATVADLALLSVTASGIGAEREPEPGEVIDDHRRQIESLRTLTREQRLRHGLDAADVVAAHRADDVACIYSVEGGDFVEDRLDRLDDAHRAGVRSITLIHYRTNQIGDTQTEAPTHGGLTQLGRETIRAMDRLGIIVDLAHATYEATRDAAEVSTRPMLISHSNIAPGHGHRRLITREHARLVTESGGVIGAVPAGFGGQATFADYIDTILRMIDMLGVDHVAIGTDMDFTFRPVFDSYRDWPLIPAALLSRGLHEAEVAKVIGGNFIRLFE